jgi:hypothetical protein
LVAGIGEQTHAQIFTSSQITNEGVQQQETAIALSPLSPSSDPGLIQMSFHQSQDSINFMRLARTLSTHLLKSKFDLPEDSHVTLAVYDMLGRKVASGVYFARFAATDANGTLKLPNVVKLMLNK